MADRFEAFLAAGLAPGLGDSDRRFVARVQATIALEEQLARQRRSLIAGLVRQLVAVAAIAAALLLVGLAAPVARLFAESPAIGLALLLTGFSLLGVMLAATAGPTAGSPFNRPAISMA